VQEERLEEKRELVAALASQLLIDEKGTTCNNRPHQ
jgi:hypothetical protein